MKMLKCGIASIQDHGRYGYRNLGINTGGPMDQAAYRLGNMLVANVPGTAAVELATGEFLGQANFRLLVAVSGLGYHVRVNEKTSPCWRPIVLEEGDLLHVIPEKGGYAYICIHGGIRTQEWLGSRSLHPACRKGGINGDLLKKGDTLPLTRFLEEQAARMVDQLRTKPAFRLSNSVIPDYDSPTIRVFAGPEWDWFDDDAKAQFLNRPFKLTPMVSRMGFRLSGNPINKSVSREMISSAVVPGTIQVSGDGQLLVLMADAQTTGGYPRIAGVSAVDLPILAAMQPGNSANFKMIPFQEAEQLLLERERLFNQIEKDLRLLHS
ncbi:biotin-dependent carboxyltransferase family protein [Flavihumibacter rivuli]|uniref:5-oxoprolinase subunit C family protein n=1 Tax=Flavihumibacter rivuli TaxID=2838156 RepID=UPI001BDE14F8|nr:biotin-dependent carboxyltransferase family protein [Flavihumibacter rivuli]ULQ55601.1 biotin-dependent carboxyltransferase family protein [Flavihumibacter rivuli]